MLLAAIFWAQMNVSAYCDYREMAGGGLPCEGVTAAADDLPFGAKVYIGDQCYVIQDRFGGNYKNRLDIYMQSEADCWEFGRQYLMVLVEVE